MVIEQSKPDGELRCAAHGLTECRKCLPALLQEKDAAEAKARALEPFVRRLPAADPQQIRSTPPK